MREKIDQFCENLRVKLTQVEESLTKVGDNLKSAPQQAADSIQSSIEAAKSQHEKNMQTLHDAKASLDERVQARKDEIETQIAEWKRSREVSKLETRADKAEGYAVAAIEFAAAAVAEADLATLEAIAARLDAEDAKASG